MKPKLNEAHFLTAIIAITYCTASLWALKQGQPWDPQRFGIGGGALASGLGAWIGIRGYSRDGTKDYARDFNQTLGDNLFSRDNRGPFSMGRDSETQRRPRENDHPDNPDGP